MRFAEICRKGENVLMDVDLSVRLGALHLKNPIMVASGTWGWGQEYAQLMDPNLLGGLVTKAVTLHPREGNPPPRIAEVPCGMLNTIGLANVGVQVFIEEKLPALRGLQTAVIVNVAGATAQEYLEVIGKLEGQPGIDALEINISCPNVKQGGLIFGSDPGSAYELLASLRRATQRFLIAKLTPQVTDIAAIARSAVDAGVDALSLINTLVGMSIDIETWRPRLSTVTGGLSGPAIRAVALGLVWKVAQEVSVPVIGIGGIMSAEDAIEFLLAGATAIQVGSGNFVEPQIPLNIVQGLEAYCARREIESVSQLVGKLRVPSQGELKEK